MSELERVPLLPDDPVEAVEPVGDEIEPIEYMRNAINVLSSLVELNRTDIAGLSRVHLLAQQVKRELDLLIEQVRPYLLDCMGKQKQIDLPGIGRLERKSGVTYRNWNHDDIRKDVRRELLERCAVDEDGAVDESIRIVVDEVLDVIKRVYGTKAPTSGGVREILRRDPDEYAEVKFGDKQVTITGALK